jgi:hypothetical protein
MEGDREAAGDRRARASRRGRRRRLARGAPANWARHRRALGLLGEVDVITDAGQALAARLAVRALRRGLRPPAQRAAAAVLECTPADRRLQRSARFSSCSSSPISRHGCAREHRLFRDAREAGHRPLMGADHPDHRRRDAQPSRWRVSDRASCHRARLPSGSGGFGAGPRSDVRRARARAPGASDRGLQTGSTRVTRSAFSHAVPDQGVGRDSTAMPSTTTSISGRS